GELEKELAQAAYVLHRKSWDREIRTRQIALWKEKLQAGYHPDQPARIYANSLDEF
ncbi:Hypothetical predicted protein, partial [Olea europaea subsp. europaea]